MNLRPVPLFFFRARPVPRGRANPRMTVKTKWSLVMLTTVIQFVLSIYVAHANTSDSFGYQSAVFAAIWSMLLTLCFTGVGSFVIFGDQKLTELQVGLFLGASTMLSELFFALMVIFYILGTNADPNSQQAGYADTVFASFCLLTSMNLTIWTMTLSTYRRVLVVPKPPVVVAAVPVYNPVVSSTAIVDLDEYEKV